LQNRITPAFASPLVLGILPDEPLDGFGFNAILAAHFHQPALDINAVFAPI